LKRDEKFCALPFGHSYFLQDPLVSLSSLASLRQALTDLRNDTMSVHAFSAAARAQDDLLQALPPAFGPVWHQLLDRLESSALFSEESCSFSQRDLLDSLALWLDKAELRLASAS
jgi:hypothetical protein